MLYVWYIESKNKGGVMVLILLQFFLFPCFFNITNKSSMIKYIYFIFLGVFFIILVTQFSFKWITNDYITLLAISNIGEASALGKTGLLKIFFPLTTVFFVVFMGGVFNKRVNIRIKFILFFVSLIVALILTYKVVRPFSKVLASYFGITGQINLNDEEINNIKAKIQRDNIVDSTEINNYIGNHNGKNIVIVFVEGMSKRIISKDVTPNIYNLSRKSFAVDKYYNHTAATFRGLRGQLTSSYQILGGYYQDKIGIGQMTPNQIYNKYKNAKVDSIANLLGEQGYYCYFQTPLSNKSPLNSIFEPMGFEKSFGFEDFKNYKKIENESISDKDNFNFLLNNLKSIKSPFFYGVYIRDTHFGMDSRDLKYKDGKNSYYNKFYNMDYWFGDFLQNFLNDKISDDTILILTSDHATFPSKDFRKIFNSDNEFFLDEIPFIVYKKNIQPNSLNVMGRNTLSFAPTVMDILGLRGISNKFLGRSIFEKNNIPEVNYIYAEGGNYFKTKNGVISIIDDKNEIEEIKKLQKFGDI